VKMCTHHRPGPGGLPLALHLSEGLGRIGGTDRALRGRIDTICFALGKHRRHGNALS
jgi:hypothetical protein